MSRKTLILLGLLAGPTACAAQPSNNGLSPGVSNVAAQRTCLAAEAVCLNDPARAAMLDAFAQNCFSPFLTAESAEAAILPTGARLDFYDARPFSDAAPSSTGGRAPTPGTDRRCEVAFDGDHGAEAAQVATDAARAEGITAEAPLPDAHAATQGTTLLAARYLNPNRIAVVTTGTRPGPNGVETYLQVERLAPLN